MAKKILKIIGIAVGIIIGIILLIFIIGNVVDLITAPMIKSMGEKALQQLSAQRREGEDNAWNFYAQAIDQIKDKALPEGTDKYLKGEVGINDDMIIAFNRHREILDFMKQGAQRPYCSIPMDYEKGIDAKLPDFVSIQKCTKLHAAQTLSAFEIGAIEDGLTNALSGITIGKHFVQGWPSLITYMIGIVITTRYLNVLETCIATGRFDKAQLAKINVTLTELERELPSMLWSIEGERDILTITLARTPLDFAIFRELFVISGNVVEMFLFRILAWRSFFSLRLAVMHAIGDWGSMVAALGSDIQSNKNTAEYDVEIARKLNLPDITKYGSSNPIYQLFMPNYEGMFKRKTRAIAKIRLLNCATLLWQYRLANGKFPSSLNTLDKHVTKDPFRDDTWDYVFTDKIVIIRSPGYNLESGDDDDLSLTLKPITIKEYLQSVNTE